MKILCINIDSITLQTPFLSFQFIYRLDALHKYVDHLIKSSEQMTNKTIRWVLEWITSSKYDSKNNLFMVKLGPVGITPLH